VGLGGELNSTSCVLLGDKAFVSQHIGDVENLETEQFLKDATDHLIRLTNSKVEAVACDLHPKFTTTRLAHELAEKNGWQLLQVQHHYAHAAALMVEHDIGEMVVVCCDGYGYGTDGEAWGGEVLLCTRGSSDFKRVAHLEEQPLLGGDLATRYPLRMAAGILYDKIDIEGWLLENRNHFPHGKTEIITILNQLEKQKDITRTTSCGRVLDAAAAVLGLCFERTYEGEPAMKLESLARQGRDALKLKPCVNDDTLETTRLILELFEKRKSLRAQDLAYSVHRYLAEGLALLAVEKARQNGVDAVGFSGGAACNEILTSIMHGIVERSGLRFFVHEAVPPGDGGISFGQAVTGGFFQT
jgi:hydrogenase maturation protein HypF